MTLRPRRWTSLLAVLASAAVLGGGIETAAAANGVVAVTVNASNGTETVPISVASVQAHSDVTQFMTFLPADSVPKASGFNGGLSIAGLAQLAGLDPSHVTQATISLPSVAQHGPNATNTSVLTGSEVAGGFFGDPAGAPKFALVEFPKGGVGFIFVRPLRSAADDNGDNEVYAAVGENLNVAFDYDGQVLAVGVPAVSDASPDLGAAAAFSAPSVTLNGVADHDGLMYAWDFGDGSTAATVAAPSHAYSLAGSWLARVTVTDATGASGVSPALMIQAGNPSPAAGGGAPPTTDGGQAPAPAPAGGSGPVDATPSGASGVTVPGPLPVAGSAPKAHPHRQTSAAATAKHHTSAATKPGAVPGHSTTTASAAPSAVDTTAAVAAPTAGDDLSAGTQPLTTPTITPAPAHATSTAPSRPTPTQGLIGVILDTPGGAAITVNAGASPPAARASQGGHGTGWGWWLLGGAALLGALGAGAVRAIEPRALYRSLAAS